MQHESNEKLFFAKIRLFESIGRLSVNGIGCSTTFLTASGVYLTSTRSPETCRASTRLRQMDPEVLKNIHQSGCESFQLKQPLIHHLGLGWFVISAININGHDSTLAIGPFNKKGVPATAPESSSDSSDAGAFDTVFTDGLESLPHIDPFIALEHAKNLTDITKMLLEELYTQNKLEKKLCNHQEYIKHLLFERKGVVDTKATLTDSLPAKPKPIALEKEYIGHIQAGNKDMANQLVSEVLDDLFSRANQDLACFKANAYELLAILIRAAVHSGVASDIMTDVIDKHYHIMKSETDVEEIHLMVSEATNTLSNAIYEIKGSLAGRAHLSKAILFIRSNYHHPVALDDVAKECDISSYYLSHLFREEMETNFVDFVNKVRLDEAKKLLENGGFTIYQAAYHCGFRDPGYFSKTFKKYLGITPRKYQQIIQR